MRSRFWFLTSMFLLLALVNHQNIYSLYNKIKGPTIHYKVTEYKFVDDYRTDLKYLNPKTKKEERVWFWWWLSTPKFYDVPENGTEYVEWVQNNLFYTDVKQHLKMSVWQKKYE